MTRLFLILALTLATSCGAQGARGAADPARAAETEEARQASFEAMTAAERAFAKLAQDKSTRDAFITYLTDDALAFSPAPERAREQWMKRPARPPGTPAPASLLWAPVFGDVSMGGDLGFSTGPYVFHDNTGKDPDEHGLFFSVWRRQASGEWRVVLDFGVSTPGPIYPLDAPLSRARSARAPLAPATAEQLKQLDRDVALTSDQGAAAFSARFAEAARMHRMGIAPLVSKREIRDYALKALERYVTQPAFAAVSELGDLGYTHGTYEGVENKTPAKGYYARVWQKQADGSWAIVADVARPEAPSAQP